MAEHVFSSDIYLGFKRIDDSVKILLDTLHKIQSSILNESIHPELQHFLDSLNLNGKLDSLISAQVIDKIEIAFKGEVGVVNIHYFHDANNSDTSDLSLLEMVPVKSNEMDVRLVVNDLKLAKLVGLQSEDKISTEHIKLTLINSPLQSSNSNIELVEKLTSDEISDIDNSNE